MDDYRSDPRWWASVPPTVPAMAEPLGLACNGKSCACPACGAERRGSADRRLPVLFTPDRRGWRCPRCDAGGSALDLAAWKLTGRRWEHGDRDAAARLRAWCAAQGWCDPDPGETATRGRPVRLVRPQGAPTPAPEPEPALPPRAEVEALWAASGRVDVTGADPDPLALEVAGWLSCERRLYPPAVAALDLARVLPRPADTPFPAWLSRRWWPGWRLVLPAWTAAGELGSLRLRAPGGARPKERAPCGVCSKGLTLADPVALTLLRGEPDPRWDGSVLVVEGCPDFLAWAIQPREDRRPAILGTWSGAWCSELAARIPDGARVILGTDDDKTGDRIALAIQRTLYPRCACGRAKVRQP